MLLLEKKINWTRYFALSLFVTGLAFIIMHLLVPGAGPLIAVAVFYAATLINQIILFEFVFKVLETAKVINGPLSGRGATGGVVFSSILFFIKFGVLIVAVGISIQFIKSEIIIPVANYLVHIVILLNSLKRSA